jgi:uncharacterized DUF497 family protein
VGPQRCCIQPATKLAVQPCARPAYVMDFERATSAFVTGHQARWKVACPRAGKRGFARTSSPPIAFGICTRAAAMAKGHSYAMIIYQRFEWDVRSAAKNLTQHGVSFKEASTVFADETHAVAPDGGSRLRAVGRSERGRSLVVTHEAGPRIRILSAELHVAKPEVVQATSSAESPAAPPPEPPTTSTATPAVKSNGHAPKAQAPTPKAQSRGSRAQAPASRPSAPAPEARTPTFTAQTPAPKIQKPISQREPRPGSWKAAARALAERLAAEERARESS